MPEKIVPKFNAVYTKGKVIFDFPDIWVNYCKAHFKEGDRLTVTPPKKYRKIRTSGQPGEDANANGYYWGVVLPIISDWTGHTVDELHEIYKAMFAPKKRYHMKNGREVVISKSTSEMDTLEFYEFIERIRAEVAQDGVVIPDPIKVDTQ